MSEQRSLEPEDKTHLSEGNLSSDKGVTLTFNGDEGIDLRRRGREPPSYHRKREMTKRISPSQIR